VSSFSLYPAISMPDLLDIKGYMAEDDYYQTREVMEA
jgi:hypothetical protein